jgi:hypothetical protein
MVHTLHTAQQAMRSGTRHMERRKARLGITLDARPALLLADITSLHAPRQPRRTVSLDTREGTHQFPPRFRDRLDPLDRLHVHRVANPNLGDPNRTEQVRPGALVGLLVRAAFVRAEDAVLRRRVSGGPRVRMRWMCADVRLGFQVLLCISGRAIGLLGCKVRRSSLSGGTVSRGVAFASTDAAHLGGLLGCSRRRIRSRLSFHLRRRRRRRIWSLRL